MIPDLPKIRESLAALSVREVERGANLSDRSLIVCESRGRMLPDRTRVEDETVIVMSQRPEAPITLDGLVKRVGEGLRNAEHAHVGRKTEYSLSLASKVLAIAAVSRAAEEGPFETLNSLLGAVSPVQLRQWAVLIRIPSVTPELYRFGDFTYGAVNLDMLRNACERAGSDYFDRYRDHLRGKVAIWRSIRELKTIDFNALNLSVETEMAARANYRITDDYYGDVAVAEKREFMLDLDRQQAIFGAVGLGTIAAETLRGLAALTHWISVFTGQKRAHGWVLPDQTFMNVCVTAPKALSDGHAVIKGLLRLEDWGNRPLDPWIQNLSEYLNAARWHEDEDRLEEALLHLVFGLDLLLGGAADDALTAVLAERVAILSHIALNQKMDEIIGFVRECYDMRSSYVHRGERGKLRDSGSVRLKGRLASLKTVSRAVLAAACFARLQPWCEQSDPEPRTAWVTRIDVLRAKRKAGLAFEPSDVQTLGLDQVRLRPGELASVAIF